MATNVVDDCLFCRIVRGEERGWIVWQDDDHVAFLTPFPNTPEFTVVATKTHCSSYVFALPETVMTKLFQASRQVASILDLALGSRRTAMVVEGFGIDHAHTKLIHLHGIPDGAWKPILSTNRNFSETYQGFVSSYDGPPADVADLNRIAQAIAPHAKH